jgi:hypothetical protein
MRKVRKKQARWEVIRLKASPAVFIGLVDAPDEETALKPDLPDMFERNRATRSKDQEFMRTN